VKSWLRAASALTAIFALGHSFGTFHEPEGAQVAAFAVIAWRDFFWAPALLNGLSAVCAVIGVTARRGSAP
jgi:hypothetical protein